MNSSLLTLVAGSAFLLLLAVNGWAVVATKRGHISLTEVLLIECATLAIASAAAGWTDMHRVFKPLTLLIAILIVVARRHAIRTAGTGKQETGSVARSGVSWLLAALAGSLAGDVFLMFDDFFIPGLVSFLLAHIAYLLLLRQGVPWFPSRLALTATLGAGAAMYAVLWTGGLPDTLRIPVAAYVSVIALMAAQAIGRAHVQRERAAWLVAAGACIFMLSDSLLAVNRFVLPLPMAQFWVLASYYAAQLLIVGGWMRGPGMR